MHRCDWPELFGMARTKDSAQRYQTILSAAILLAEVVGWERDYLGPTYNEAPGAGRKNVGPTKAMNTVDQHLGQDDLIG